MAFYEYSFVDDTIKVSPELRKLLGMPEGYNPSMDEVRTYYFPGARDQILAAVHEAQKNQQRFFEVEFRYFKEGKKLSWALLRGATRLSDQGELEGVLGVVVDISERKESEERLIAHNKTLQSNVDQLKNQLEKMFALSWDLFAVGDFKGYFHYVNPAWSRLLGYSDQDLLKTPFIELCHPDDRHEVVEAAKSLSEGTYFPRITIRLRRKDKRYRWYSWSAVKEGDLFYTVGRDVTSEVRNRKALERLNERLRTEIRERERAEEALSQSQKMEALGHLTGGIAHDFNNLLTVISSSLDVVERSENPQENWALVKDSVRQAASRGQDLTRKLLSFSRRQKLNPKVVNLQKCIADFQAVLKRSLHGDIRSQLLIPHDLWKVEVDVVQFELSLLNILVNARDAMPEGGKVTIKARNISNPNIPDLKGDFVRLSITDTGKGMTKEVQEHIFEPFFTTKDKDKGTGLGLSQVYGFARQSGGTATVKSQPGKGTTINIYLPRSQKPISE